MSLIFFSIKFITAAYFTDIAFYYSQSIANSHTHSSAFVPATLVSEVPSTDGQMARPKRE